MKVRINIDSMVLKGLDGNNAAKFAQEVKQELSKLVQENGVQGISGTDVLDTDIMRLAVDAKSHATAGAQVARSIYSSLNTKNGG